MKTFLKAITVGFCSLSIVVLCVFVYLFFSERPETQTDPATLAGDGAAINYCQLPALNGLGKSAVDIPKGNTPGCGYTHFPLPILANCTEPLTQGADDIRGLWQEVTDDQANNDATRHVERIEQCGARTVITTAGIIHDYGPNSTGELNTADTEGSVFFTINNKEYCGKTSASMIWQQSKLNFHVFGWGPVVVRRYLEDQQLIWEYADGSVTRMERICTLPENHRVPSPRGRRFAL